MFRSRFTRTLTIIVFITAGAPVCSAQGEDHRFEDVKQAAIEQFQNEHYAAALNGFQKLIRQYPKDPKYKYYKGVCLVELDQNIEEAAELLQFASGRDVPEDVNYYLGEAYRKSYDFKKAKKSYIRFDKEASRSATRSENSKLLIRSADHARDITAAYNPTEVMNLHFINLSDPDEYGQLEGKGGQLMRKPTEFFKEQEERDDLNALMFMPAKVTRGQYVYYTGMHGRDGFEVMKAKRSNTGKWTEMRPVDNLNTPGDEILPYYDPVGNDIYFASNGHEGLGGFDLYRSHYDEENDSWSEPVNLGFPVNSVYDDYISIPGSDLGMIMLVTARHSKDSAIAAYRIHLIEPRKSLASASPKEIRNISMLGYVGAENVNNPDVRNENYLADQTVSEEGGKTTATDVERVDKATLNEEQGQKVSKNALRAQHSKVDLKEANLENDHQALINSALKHQRIADSLSELSSDAAVMVRKLDDPDDRWVYQKQILVWNKKAAEEKTLADKLFAQIAKHEQNLFPSAVTPDTVINEMIVYKYTMADSIHSKAREVFSQVVADNVPASGPSDANPPAPSVIPEILPEDSDEDASQGIVRKKPGGEKMETGFTVFNESIYNDAKPIPEINVPPGGPSYRIQLAVFSTPAENNAFGGITPVAYEILEGRGLLRYYAGNFYRFKDAEEALVTIRQQGYSDAYIVGWFDGKKMSYEKVRKLE